MTHIGKALRSADVAPEGAWRKSSYSDQQGGNCVEVTTVVAGIGIRDSKDKAGLAFIVTDGAWTSFVGLVSSTPAQ
ncbi:DUF397 domain-containing protein [Streptomyces sp. NPDC051572]|uniref:DUF397 domain-containing protein n=1 Tax=Streptomyces sp. NPDC051572 TaxID=3155802 RepID=UPI00344EBBB5